MDDHNKAFQTQLFQQISQNMQTPHQNSDLLIDYNKHNQIELINGRVFMVELEKLKGQVFWMDCKGWRFPLHVTIYDPLFMGEIYITSKYDNPSMLNNEKIEKSNDFYINYDQRMRFNEEKIKKIYFSVRVFKTISTKIKATFNSENNWILPSQGNPALVSQIDKQGTKNWNIDYWECLEFTDNYYENFTKAANINKQTVTTSNQLELMNPTSDLNNSKDDFKKQTINTCRQFADEGTSKHTNVSQKNHLIAKYYN